MCGIGLHEIKVRFSVLGSWLPEHSQVMFSYGQLPAPVNLWRSEIRGPWDISERRSGFKLLACRQSEEWRALFRYSSSFQTLSIGAFNYGHVWEFS